MSARTQGSPLDAVTALMAERQRYEQWLAALEARRAGTAQHVYERVHADYTSRLARVVEELRKHAAELEAQAARLASRLSELSAQEHQHRDERAEAELRAHVGELTPEQWEASAKQSDDALAEIAAEQAVVGAELNRIHELLSATSGTPAASVPAVEEEPLPAAEAAEAGPSVAAAARASVETVAASAADETPAAGSSAADASAFDELAFLKSVVASPVAPSTPVMMDGAADSVVEEPPVGPPSDGILRDSSDSLAGSLTSRAGRPSQERAFVREDELDAATLPTPTPPDSRPGSDRPFAANVTGNNPIVLRPSGAVEQPKTLKCGECGAMNYPTEWYCERCGAELASL
ncbi:MAG TPA: hypothetical protein VG818_05555 [Gemmatimonadaceae bacterium]|nr:hypothetical protein [Gemmatimonadaceae bacterium]